MSSFSDDRDNAARLRRIAELTQELGRLQADSAAARALAERIQREIIIARASYRIIDTQ